MYYIAGVLITGSYSAAGNTAELYLPSSGATCTLPSLPDSRAWHSVTEGGLLCGGWYTGGWYTQYSCLQWSPDSGTWEEALTLDVIRVYHVSWTPENSSGTYLMGGGDSFEESTSTTTLITPDGSQEPGFMLKYFTK